MKSIKRTVLTVVLGSAAVVALAGWAGGPHCGRGHSPEEVQKFTTRLVERAMDDIDATDVQRAKAESLRSDLVKKGMTFQEGKKETHEFMLEAWKSDNPDPAKVHAEIDARIEDMREMAHSAADAALEMHKVLTPEQRAQLAERAEQRWD
jgi:Spy/CpxP family protein refolding chaperone